MPRTELRLTALQICFFMFAVLLVTVPLGRSVAVYAASADAAALLQRIVPFSLFALLVVAIPPLRQSARRLLSVPIPSHRRAEVALVSLSMAIVPLASVGARALSKWLEGGATALSGFRMDPHSSYVFAWSAPGLAQFLLLGAVVAPILEELLCRGYLYRALVREYHWIASLIVTSTVFGLYHAYFLNAFLISLVLVCVYRRTGSLRAAIYVHAFSNLMVWYPLLGQHLFPDPSRPAGDLFTWGLQLTALALACIVIPVYVWLSRDLTAAPTVQLEPHVALQK